MNKVLLVLLLLLSAAHCAYALPAERGFWMGFTPFPYDTTDAALVYTQQRLAEDADLISNHLDEGVPWLELSEDQPITGQLAEEWAYRRTLAEGKTSLLSITPIDISRTQLAPYFSPTGVQPLPEPWSGYSFDHPDVKTAYLAYARRAIAHFEPDYLVTGIEVNGLMKNNPAAWPAYAELHRHVYRALKRDFPDLPIMVSMVGIDLLEGASDADHEQQMQAFEQITPYSDYFALSLYPYLSVFTTDEIPPDLFTRLRALSDKPMAIAETGYPAQAFTLTFPDGPYTFTGTEQKQNEYMNLLFTSAQALDMRFVVNFILRDYDRVWQQLGQDETLAIWRDTGMYDEQGDLRPAGQLWKEWRALPARVSTRGSLFEPQIVPANQFWALVFLILLMLAHASRLYSPIKRMTG